MPSFAAKVAVKVASFKKGAKKVVAKLSFKKGMSDKAIDKVARQVAADLDAKFAAQVVEIAVVAPIQLAAAVVPVVEPTLALAVVHEEDPAIAIVTIHDFTAEKQVTLSFVPTAVLAIEQTAVYCPGPALPSRIPIRIKGHSLANTHINISAPGSRLRLPSARRTVAVNNKIRDSTLIRAFKLKAPLPARLPAPTIPLPATPPYASILTVTPPRRRDVIARTYGRTPSPSSSLSSSASTEFPGTPQDEKVQPSFARVQGRKIERVPTFIPY